MEIKTKLSVGDEMFVIIESEYDKPITCVSCDGRGSIVLRSGRNYTCPDCNGNGSTCKKITKDWRVLDDRASSSVFQMFGKPVGEINIRITKDGRKKEPTVKVTYSPQGFGNFYYEENVFASLNEAQAECDRRNKLIQKGKE